jgi:hypothetical protein
MIIQQAGHYIVRVQSNQGTQFAHMELPANYDTDSHPLFREVHTGPHPDAVTAWIEHRRLRLAQP